MAERPMQLEDWLDDLCVRFIMNVPQADLMSMERITFQIEEAQWYYEDFIRPLDPSLPSLPLQPFITKIMGHCPFFSQYPETYSVEVFKQFMEYKKRIPVRGAIMLNREMDSVVLVKGYKKNGNWSFPRGKTNLEEDPLACAVREVYEETGFNLEAAGLVPKDRNVYSICHNIQAQQIQLFVFRDVPMDTHFEPRTRKEISKIEWWKLSSLPAYRKKNQQHDPQAGLNANKFYVVAPFLVRLRKWIIEQKKKDSRRLSNQRYSNHDEIFTEEDQEVESSDPAPIYAPEPPSMENMDHSASGPPSLNRLLNIQHSENSLTGPPAVPSPPSFSILPAPSGPSGTTNSGTRLLALLHNKQPVTSLKPLHQNAPPLKSLDQEVGQSTMPRSPHHHRPRPPSFTTIPPPPKFPTSSQEIPFAYQQRPNYQQPPLHQNPSQNRFPNAISYGNPHSNQPPHLVHPQPLPPHVQRAVFTGGPVHAPMAPVAPIAPMAPRALQQRPHALNQTVSATVSHSQYSGLQPTMIPQLQEQSPPKLTSHSLALLNAFKSRDQATGESPGSNDLPLRRYTQQPAPPQRSQPQELLGDMTQPGEKYPEVSLFQSHNTNLSMNEKLLTARQTMISDRERHKSTLLELFKSPTTAGPPPEPLSATALPTSATPSAVELSAVEPLSNAATTSALLHDKKPTDSSKQGRIPELNPEASLPYRAHTILSRPSELSDQEIPIRNPQTHKAQQRGNAKRPATNVSSQESKSSSSEKPFRPQILKRPQQGPVKVPTTSPPAGTALPRAPQPSRSQRANQAADHKQTLLSLFGKNLPEAASMSQNSSGSGLTSLPPLEPVVNLSARSRVGSLASGDGNPRRGSHTHTPISPADTGFLLGYLAEAVAKGTQR